MRTFLLCCCLLAALPSLAQPLPGQTVKGVVTDHTTHRPLPGVTISIPGTTMGAVTNESGEFRIAAVPVGRHTLRAGMLGYEAVLLRNIEVNAGKETVLEITLLETVVKLADATVVGNSRHTAINPLAQVSARQLNMEEGMRYAGTRNDPSRMAQNFAGVSGANDARNDIIIRGNSPTGVLWRVEGVDVPNPNHFSTLGATGGPVTILNTNTLRNSDFLSGAFPASYGNALAGAFDLSLRNGNKDKYEFLAQVGFNGFEAAAEGPLGKPGKASFMVDYRYSLLAAVQALGLSVGTGGNVPNYQDLNMKIHLPTKRAGTFNLFAMGGLSNINFMPGEDSTSLYNTGDRELNSVSNTGVVGLTHSYNFSSNTYGRAFAAISSTESKLDEFTVKDAVRDERTLLVNYKLTKASAGYQLVHRFSARNQLSGGVSAELMQLALHKELIRNGDTQLSTLVNTKESAGFVKGWANWQHRFSNTLVANAGVYTQHFALNGTSNVEPRFSLRYAFSPGHALSLGGGLHSQLQPLEIYFYETEGQRTNKNLTATRAWHAVLGYDVQLAEKLRLKAETYYQHLFDAAVERLPTSFSLLTAGEGFGFPNEANLVNAGLGRNYGVELTLEKYLHKGFYFLFTQSLFSSKYRGSDHIWRNTPFNSQYVTNVLAGKEWTLKPGFNIGVDSKLSYAGGQWYTPFDVPATVAAKYAVYQEENAFSERNDAYFRWDLKFSFTWELGKTTQKFFIDLQNLTGRENIYTRRINTETGNISRVNQIGLFPNVNYQFTF